MNPYYTKKFTLGDQTFTIGHHFDDNAGAPWEEADGHGPVSDWTDATEDERPGALVLMRDGNRYRYYDFDAAVQTALREQWNSCTTIEEAKDAARKDYEYLRAWYMDEWHYCGVVVQLEGTDHQASLWGIESSDKDYLEEVEKELTDQLLDDLFVYLEREEKRLATLRAFAIKHAKEVTS